jgi:murein DD-endopeptidase MepM/ murein hydrolase activator NlpD
MPGNLGKKPHKPPKETVNGPKIFAPIGGKPTEIGGVFGEDRGDHIHAGLDIDCPVGTPCIAPVDGRIVQFAQDHDFAPGEGAHGGGGMIQFQFLQDLGPIKKGDVIGWGHVFHVYAQVGEAVKAGQKIASSGETTFNHAPFHLSEPR